MPRSSLPRLLLPALVLATALPPIARAQHDRSPDPPPSPLTAIVEAERSLLARTTAHGWDPALAEFLAWTGVIVERRDSDRATLRGADAAAIPISWEPRSGDVSRSGELGYVTGPALLQTAPASASRSPSAAFLRVWKRQPDATFRIVMNIRTPTPKPAPFPPEFTRAAHEDRFSGDYNEDTPPLSAADGVLNSGLRTNQARAYRSVLAPATRFHRPGVMPLTSQRRISAWLASQPALSSSDTRYSEVARSGDLGYTWGSYSIAARRRRGATATPAARGLYVRVWIRERTGQWRIAIDATMPQ